MGSTLYSILLGCIIVHPDNGTFMPCLDNRIRDSFHGLTVQFQTPQTRLTSKRDIPTFSFMVMQMILTSKPSLRRIPFP